MGDLAKLNKELEGIHYSILQDYLETGNKELIENESMFIYLEQLDKVRGWHYSLQTESKIVKALIAAYPGMNPREAKSRYTDTINYFYGDTEIKQEAYKNMIADEMHKVFIAMILSAKENKDYKAAADVLYKEATIRGVFEKEEEKLPAHLFENKTNIYVINPELVGLPKANRNAIAEQIDSMPITELEKKKLRGESGIEALQLFDEDE